MKDPSVGSHRRPLPPPDPIRDVVDVSLAAFTVLWVIVYFPFETYLSWRGTGFLRFAYLIDLIGIALLVAGAAAVWRVRPYGGIVMAAGWAWTAANFWRGTMERYQAIKHFGWVFPGPYALWLGPLLTAVAVAALGVSLWFAVVRAPQERQ